MMDRKKAAEYFIVAWVKDWSLRTYLTALADGGPRIDFDQANALYPWLPGPHAFIRKHLVRTYLADANRPLSDALFDAVGDSARLALAPQVEAFVCTRRPSVYVDEARRAYRRERNRLSLNTSVEIASVDDMRRGNGSHWKVCK
jgi:hypothetical protein